MGLKFNLGLFLSLTAFLFNTSCSSSVDVDKLGQNIQPQKVERKMPYLPANGYSKIDEKRWFSYNSSIPYSPELDMLDGRLDGNVSSAITWHGTVAYNDGEFVAVTVDAVNGLKTPKIFHLDRYGNLQLLFNEPFSQRFDRISLDVQDYGAGNSEDEIALVMRYGDKKSLLVIDPKTRRPLFWYENDDIILTNYKDGRIVVGRSNTENEPIFETYKWDGEKYAKIGLPEEVQDRLTNRRIVFASGICSSNPRNDFSEARDWLVEEMGYTDSDIVYFNYTKGGSAGMPYSPEDTLAPIDESARNFHNFLKATHDVWPDAKFDVIAHSLGGVIAVHALDKSPEIWSVVNSIVTINSPFHGVDTIKLNIESGLPCIHNYAARYNKLPDVLSDLKEGSPVISNIENTDHSKYNVINIVNSSDPVVSSRQHENGEAGILDKKSGRVFQLGIDPPIGMVLRYPSFAIPLNYPHGGLLKIRSLEEFGGSDAAEFMKKSLREAINSN